MNGTMSPCDTNVATGDWRSRWAIPNSTVISAPQPQTIASGSSSRGVKSRQAATWTPATASAATVNWRKVTSPRGTGRSGRKRASASRSFHSSATRNWKNAPRLTTKAAATAPQPGPSAPRSAAEAQATPPANASTKGPCANNGKRSWR